MREWFPFTDYDFYGYLASGLMVLFAVDYWQTGGTVLIGNDLNFVQGVLAVALAYMVGQVIAIPSSIVLEMGFARKLLRPPVAVLLDNKAKWRERQISAFLVGRYYAPLPQRTRDRIFQLAKKEEGLTPAQIKASPDSIFEAAFRYARKNDGACQRIDNFRNQYGFARNIAFSGLLIAVLLFDRGAWDGAAYTLAWCAVALSVGMLIRFIKFYSCFAGEVLKTYAYKEA